MTVLMTDSTEGGVGTTYLLYRAVAIVGNGYSHPVSDDGRIAAFAKAAPRLALIFGLSAADIIEAADGFHYDSLLPGHA